MRAERRTPRSSQSDPDLPALAQALDGRRMLPWVVQAAGLGREPHGLRCVPEVLSHKPGRRCTIRYGWARERARSREPLPPPVIGKLYRSRRRARRAYERMKALRSTAPGGCSVPSIPRCLLSVRPLGLFFQEWVDGTELDHIVAADGGAAPLELAAQWLLRLHASPAPEGLTVVSRDRTLEKVDAWCETAAAQLPESATRLGRARASFRKRAAGTPSAVGALVHKDYYHAQVLWDGTRIWVLDFDELSLGDPALDVGHFLAHLEYKAYLKTGSEQGYRASTALFAARYADHAPPDLGERLPLYKAYTFLKLAHTEVVRRRDSWRPRARVLIELALRELGARAYGVALRGTRSSGAPGATWE